MPESQLDRMERRQVRIEQKIDLALALERVTLSEQFLMATNLDALTTQVTANTDAEASAITVLNQLHQLLVDAGTDPVKLDALRAQLSTSKDALAAAIVANTPAAT